MNAGIGAKSAALVLGLFATAWAGQSLACSDAAWTGTPGANAHTLGGPGVGAPNGASTFKRVKGSCGLEANVLGNSFVAQSSSEDEPVFRVRFHVFPGVTGANPKVFAAYSDVDGAGTEMLSVVHDSVNGLLQFNVAGETLSTAPGSVPANSGWYAVEGLFSAGSTFTASVRPPALQVADPANLTVTGAANASGTVRSFRFGSIDPTPAATGTVRVDEFEASRSADTAIGFFCRGDANDDGAVDVIDVAFVIAERRGEAIAPGVPDIDADGLVNTTDAALAITMRRNVPRKTCP